MPTKYKQDTN